MRLYSILVLDGKVNSSTLEEMMKEMRSEIQMELDKAALLGGGAASPKKEAEELTIPVSVRDKGLPGLL